MQESQPITFRARLQKLGKQNSQQTISLEHHQLGKKYVIMKLLAVGNRSTIYTGIESKTGLQRAFKYYNLKELEAQKDWREKEVCKRLSSVEVDIMLSCKSSNVLHCYDVFEDTFSKVLVVDYCNEGSLKDEIKRRDFKPTDQVRAILILKQVLSGLKSMHRECRMLHKNLRSEKIMVKNGVYKLIDFGLPEVLGVSDSAKDDSFIVPQLLRKRPYDSKVDVWSVGVLFHQILYGKLPELVNKKNKFQLIGHSQPSAFTYSLNQRGDYSKYVLDFLENSLKIEPENRMTWLQLQSHVMFTLLDTNRPIRISEASSINEEASAGMISVIAPFSDDSGQINCLPSKSIPSKSARVEEVQKSESSDEMRSGWSSQKERLEFYETRFNIEDERGKIQEKLKASYIKSGETYLTNKLQPEMIDFFKDKINTEEDKSYNRLKEYYWQCLKMQFIQQQIYKSLIHKDILDQTKRQVIEFTYLVISRSFYEISKINEYTHHREHFSKEYSIMQECIVKQTKKLYDDVRFEFGKIAQNLKHAEDRVSSMVFDRIAKTFSKSDYNNKERLMQGIIGLDLTISEQMNYTMRKYHDQINQLLLNPKGRNGRIQGFALKLDQYLQRYQNIWEIPQKEQEMWGSVREYVKEKLVREFDQGRRR